ncbi:MAG: AraC family transcriptional regulator [Paenibacillus sp.]|nr:AraC family transcriptional regulator [Paenibacillus sp.]
MSKKLQIVVTNIIVTSLSIVLIGLIIFNLASDIIRNEIENIHLISLQQTRDRFESYFKQLNQAAIQMEKVPDFDKWTGQPPETRLTQFDKLALVELLVRVQASMDYVDNVVLFDLSTKVNYSSQPIMNEVHHNYTPLMEQFTALNKDQAFLTRDSNGYSTYVYIRKLPIFKGGPSSYLLFHINSKLFYDYLGITDQRAPAETAFIMDGNGSPIGKGTFTGIEDVTRTLAHDRQLMSLPAEQSLNLTKNGLLITYVASSVTGWIFGLAVPEEQFLSKINSFRNITLFILLTAIGVTMLAAFLSNHWFFRGWNKIIRLIDDSTGGKPASKPNDDEIEKIYSHVYELKHSLREIMPAAKEAYLRKVFETGIITKEDWTDQFALPLHEHTVYRSFAVELDYYNQLKETYSGWDLFYFEYGIASVVREVLSDNGLAVKLNDGRLIGVACLKSPGSGLGEPSFREQVNNWMLTIHDFISEHFPITVTIGVSQPHQGTKHLHVSASEALEVLKQKFSYGTNKILYYEDLSSVTEADFSSDESRRIEQDLINSIRMRNMEDMQLVLNRLRLLTTEGDYRKLQHLLVDLTFSVYREIEQDLLEPLEPPSLSGLLSLTTMEEWMNWLQHQCAYLILRLTEEYRSQMEQAAKQLREYVSLHVLQDIRLEDCCKALGIPVSVAKQALKEVYETSFAELLLLERIEQSKQWLRETDIGVDEIAKRLFYSNAQSFTRTFKKATGMPPGQYRKQSSP